MTQAAEEFEISLNDIWQTIKRYKQTILIAPVVCGIAAYVLVSFVMAPKWEASAIFRIGQIGGEKTIESAGSVMARMQHPTFAADVMSRTKLASADLRDAKNLYEDSLKVKKIDNEDLVELKVWGYSPETARALAANSVSYLQEIENDKLTGSVASIKAQLQHVDEEIQKIVLERDFMKKQLHGDRNWNSYTATIAATVLEDESKQLRDLEQRKHELTEQLRPYATYATKVIGGVWVSERPVSPKRSAIVGMALLLGLFGGLAIAFVHNALSKSNVDSKC
ncbi:hypothetical protein FGKAn22_23240 [Ferrigenium kumadai]|uniref:Polysaccharide chain length determinant N-terminal domain-containing protein n=1 Tax=Ferrigenium kumadai TaxID=1682490 RepID=A0AAN1T1K9_9PROT|nr:Wzz/FepE/Etk N-terminal domain-containing protein [Ferrigenium kumadai]BBJ00632.1 hypothetical protein FGKAn22_23240 [Ferrigenium kumadai]